MFFTSKLIAQHYNNLNVEVNLESNSLQVNQELIFYNQSNDTLKKIVLNDWNNAYSDKNSPLGKRFSDEFIRIFHLAKTKERGITTINSIVDLERNTLLWKRPVGTPDLIEIELPVALLPNEKTTFILAYSLQIPDYKFTKYGVDSKGNYMLENWFLTPSLYKNHQFANYSNLNIDDNPNAIFDANIMIKLPENIEITCDLNLSNKSETNISFSGKKLMDIPLYFEKKDTFTSFNNAFISVISNLQEKNVTNIQKAIVIDKIVNYVSTNLGKSDLSKITVSQTDYDKNPFYGLNQLPSFFSPFSNEFIFEMKFLKTYLNNYLKNTLQLDSRKDNWIYDALQVYLMMRYIEDFYPDAKMTGSLSRYKLIKGYNLVSLDFNQQYSYFYTLMARRNQDQPLGNSKNTLLKYNEKIASKYRAGLNMKYLENYIGKELLNSSILEFMKYSTENPSDSEKLITILKKNTTKNIDWFDTTLIKTRDLIDFKFKNVTKTKETVSFSLKNKTQTIVPISVFGLKNKKVVFKEWIIPNQQDSIYTLDRKNADKLAINYENEIPEYNLRNNWRSLKKVRFTNKPIKFIFLKDLEQPAYNQIVFVPTLEYNLYDGFIAGMSFLNKTILEKPLNFDFAPSYSTKSEDFSGSFSVVLNHNIRDGKLFLIKYGIAGSTFHYAPDASYQKVNPYIQFRFREDDYRINRAKFITARQVYVNREKSTFVKNTFEGNYSVFNLRFSAGGNEITKAFGYSSDLQLGSNFGKLAGEVFYRRLFDDNRQVSFRIFVGAFLYNSNTTYYFNFASDRPSDYLFDYNYLGRSENTGLFSQQYILAEGGFKSKIPNSNPNQFILATNASFNVWNWIEIYGDLGMIKSKNQNQKFIYDSGIRLNLVTDYFELYFPVYSNNGWEVGQQHYADKIRFIASFSTNTVIKLFSRKWF